jgi:hypothetical protein
MTSPLPANSSQTARLMVAPPGFAVGWQEPVYVATPAAGAEWSHTVDGRYHERLVSVHYVFNTSAVAGDRTIGIELTDTNGTVITGVPGGAGIAPSDGAIVDLINGAPAFDVGATGSTYGFLSDILAPPGWIWKSSTFNLDAGDAYTDVVLLVQRFPNDAASIQATG